MSFGRLTVIEFSYTKDKRNFWECSCSCGGSKIVTSSSLLRGVTKSCGCIHREMLANRNIANTGKKASEEAKKRMSEAQKAYKHWNWVGGHYQNRRNNHATDIWTKEVKNRDSWVCVVCGTKSYDIATKIRTPMHAHHILAVKDYTEEQFVVDNGETLCKACHKQTHKQRSLFFTICNKLSPDRYK